MAANDEFPRGWVFSARASGGSTATVTVPAVIGVTHVLDFFVGKIVNASGVALGPSVVVANAVILADLFCAANGVDESSDSVSLAGALGASLVVGFVGVAPANTEQFIYITGHDV